MDRRGNFCADQRAAADSEHCPASPRCPTQSGQGLEKIAVEFLSSIIFIHPKGNEQFALGGEGVLIELVQAPPEVIAALR